LAEIGTDIQQAAHFLREGHLVGIPTETVYGLAANGLDARAVAKIFEVKQRPSFDPLITHVADIDQMLQFVAHVPEKARLLAERFWPGPLTLVLKKQSVVPDLVTSGLDTLAVRVPDHPLTKALLKEVDFPLAAPSANPFGYVSPTNAVHVNDQLGKYIPYILDGGDCQIGIESTIIGFSGDMPVIFRLGGFSVEKIKEVVGAVEVRLHSSSRPSSPGMLESHYAPMTRIFMGDIEQLLKHHGKEGSGILSFREAYTEVEPDCQFILSPAGSITEAATRLFSGLRQLDQLNLQRILTEPVPDEGLGRAINDRLKRASTINQNE